MRSTGRHPNRDRNLAAWRPEASAEAGIANPRSRPGEPVVRRYRWLLIPLIVTPLTIVLIVPMLLTALVKRLVPIPPVTRACRIIVAWIAGRWMDVLVGLFRRCLDMRLELTGELPDDRERSYVVVCNHQSWSDVPVLLCILHGRVPFFRFFLKHGLIWLPLVGQAFWALEYPFVRFPSRDVLERHPERRGQNLRAARRACEHLADRATTLVNFPEGALFTRARHAEQRARFHHLLRPRAGGTALALATLSDRLDALIDVSLHFPDGPPGLDRFITNRVRRVQVDVRRIEVPPEMTQGDYENDPDFRRRFQHWLNAIWREKDRRLETMRNGSGHRSTP
jgi:1-acyl-sn-glycerol-3-phosphate acyltransferase